MIKRQIRRLVGLALVLVAAGCYGCADTNFLKEYKLTQPSESMYCSSGASSPFPPYCHPDRW